MVDNVHPLQQEPVSDDALMQRLFELARDERCDQRELARVDALVYARLAAAYGEPAPSGDARLAA